MKRGYSLFILFALIVLSVHIECVAEIRSAGVKGVWSATTTWAGGILPGPTDVVTIVDNDTVTIDGGVITLAGLTVGEGISGRIKFSTSLPVKLTINGDLTIGDSASFTTQTNTLSGLNLVDTLIITGNIKSTGKFILKSGSGTSNTISIVNVIFTGSGNSTVDIYGPYSTAANIWGGFTVNKSGTGKVILNSDVYFPGGTSNIVPASANSTLTFTRGVIDTKQFSLIHYWTTDAGIGPGSDSSYVIGFIGRGGSSGTANITRTFPVGDAKGYRPVTIRATTTGLKTSHHIKVGCISGNANTGSSTFAGDIDKVSSVRYYKLSYHKGYDATAAASMSFDKYTLSYGKTDGVAEGNQNLRIANGGSTRAAWTGYGPTTVPYTTSFATLPAMIPSDTTTVTTLNDGEFIYLALARKTGTAENLLPVLQRINNVPAHFSLEQNYPNPFNGMTNYELRITNEGHVSIKVYDALGREIAVLVNEVLQPGMYRMRWDAVGFASGVYYYTMTAGEFRQTKSMILMK